MSRPLAIDLFCGLGGWTEGLLLAGYDVIGFDIEAHRYGEHRYPAQLVIQDVLTLHGSQFKDAALIVASPPCQEYSYMAMPWTKAKAKAAAIRADESGAELERLNRLFNACLRIQREACEAAGHHIPMVIENVRGAQPWVGRARWSFGSFYLWGDVPALMPLIFRAPKQDRQVLQKDGHNVILPQVVYREDGTKGAPYPTGRQHATKNTGGSWFNIAHNTTSGKGNNPDGRKTRGHINKRDGNPHTKHLTNPGEHGVKQGGSGRAWFDKALDERRKNPDGRKVGGDWFGTGNDRSVMRQHHSGSTKRKFASAMIAKIPLPLSLHIASTYSPHHPDSLI